jgi:hypothetical protein
MQQSAAFRCRAGKNMMAFVIVAGGTLLMFYLLTRLQRSKPGSRSSDGFASDGGNCAGSDSGSSSIFAGDFWATDSSGNPTDSGGGGDSGGGDGGGD